MLHGHGREEQQPESEDKSELHEETGSSYIIYDLVQLLPKVLLKMYSPKACFNPRVDNIVQYYYYFVTSQRLPLPTSSQNNCCCRLQLLRHHRRFHKY